MQQAVGDVGEVVQTVAQIGVGLTLQLGAGVVLHLFDCGFGREAAAHRLAQAPEPATIMRDHAERFQHVAMLAGFAVVGAIDHLVDGSAHRFDRGVEPLQFGVDVVGDDLRDDNTGLVQNRMAEAQAFGDRHALDGERPANRDRRRLPGDSLQFTRRDHLGQQHRGRLQRLDLFFRIGSARTVLHDEHAERRAATQHGHA